MGTAKFRSRLRPFTLANKLILIYFCSLKGQEVVVENEEEGQLVRKYVDIDNVDDWKILLETSLKIF